MSKLKISLKLTWIFRNLHCVFLVSSYDKSGLRRNKDFRHELFTAVMRKRCSHIYHPDATIICN